MTLPLRCCLISEFEETERSSPGNFFGVKQHTRSPFRVPFERIEGLKIVAECTTWKDMQDLLKSEPFDVAIVDLDSRAERELHVVRRIAEVAPDCGIIGVSQNASPDAIIAAMRAGCSQYVRWPIDPTDLCSALERVRKKAPSAVAGSLRVGVVGSSGGTGATTVACNLAMELAHVTDHDCALVDMNLHFGDVGCSFDVSPRYSIADICRAGAEIDTTLLEGALNDMPCRVSILARPNDLRMADEIAPESVEQCFHVLGELFPFVVVDLPRYFSPPTVAALSGAGRVLIVSQLAVPNVRNASRVYQQLVHAGVAEEKIEIVLNRANANFGRIKPDEVAAHFGRPVFAVIPNDYKRIGASRDLGHPIMTDAPNSPARLAIRDMAERLATDHLGEKNVRTNGKGMLGMFRKRRAKSKQVATAE